MQNSIPNEIIQILPSAWHEKFLKCQGTVYELRMRVGQSLCLKLHSGYWSIDHITVTGDDIAFVIKSICHNSFYAYENELRMGFFTIAGGHRIGFSGQVITNEKGIIRIKNFNSLNIRVAREVKGVALPIVSSCWDNLNQRLYNTLFIAAPGGGKTTMLRDMARIVSSGLESLNLLPHQVSIVDERSEIASCHQGIPQLDVGPNTDVLDCCPKFHGAMLMLRSMGPQVLVVDELGSSQDVSIVEECINSGVIIFASAHANSIAELKQRPTLLNLFINKLFKRIVLIKNQGAEVTIFDENGELLREDTDDSTT